MTEGIAHALEFKVQEREKANLELPVDFERSFGKFSVP
jgi:hypothetical protein